MAEYNTRPRKILVTTRVVDSDGIGKRNCRRELGAIDNLATQVAHSCVVQIHTYLLILKTIEKTLYASI
nr:MAG TPA: hypothetical protein [Bacteriophage sp.]